MYMVGGRVHVVEFEYVMMVVAKVDIEFHKFDIVWYVLRGKDSCEL